MSNEINYAHVSLVLETWELFHQRHGCAKELGRKTLFKLFELEPSIKTFFGFQPDQEVEDNPMLKMGATIHGDELVSMVDTIVDFLGPDTEALAEVLTQLNQELCGYSLKLEHFDLLGQALCMALQDILRKTYWSADVDQAWAAVFQQITKEVLLDGTQ